MWSGDMNNGQIRIHWGSVFINRNNYIQWEIVEYYLIFSELNEAELEEPAVCMWGILEVRYSHIKDRLKVMTVNRQLGQIQLEPTL